jgi:hypothetical protein
MRRATLPLLILGCIVVAVALAWWTLNRGGGGATVVTETRAVTAFHKLDVDGNAEVTLVASPQQEVVVEAPSNVQSRVRVRVEGDTLNISGGHTRRWWHAIIGTGRAPPAPRITVKFKNLDTIVLSGSVKLTAGKLEAQTLRIAASGGSSLRVDDIAAQALKLSGAGALKATLGGKVVDSDISISGAGDVRAGELTSENARVSVSGAGSIVLRAEKTLRASISGAGSVEYYGNPEVKQEISGVGRVKRRESARVDGVHAALGRGDPARDAPSRGNAQCSASARNSRGTPVSASRSAWTPRSTRTSATRQSASSVVNIWTRSAVRSAA